MYLDSWSFILYLKTPKIKISYIVYLDTFFPLSCSSAMNNEYSAYRHRATYFPRQSSIYCIYYSFWSVENKTALPLRVRLTWLRHPRSCRILYAAATVILLSRTTLDILNLTRPWPIVVRGRFALTFKLG